MQEAETLTYAVLRAARPTEPFLRWAVAPAALLSARGDAAAVAWSMVSPYNGNPWVTGIGEAGAVVAAAVALVGTADRSADAVSGPPASGPPASGPPASGPPVSGPIVGVTLPQPASEEVTRLWPGIRLADWTWWYATAPPPQRPGESRVTTIDPADLRLGPLLAQSSSVYLRPGNPRATGWYGIESAAGELLACAATERHSPAAVNLASVVVDRGARGEGLGRDLCSAITRDALAAGAGAVTLGMMSDNEPASAVYSAIGFTAVHRFVSGYLPGRRPARIIGGVASEAATA